ncbi:unnamed protein product [Jaminaea pallidilutea]
MSIEEQDPTTKLLTLLNVSATKPGKRKRSAQAYRAAPLGGKRKASATTIATTADGVSNFDSVHDRVNEAAAVVAAAAAKKGGKQSEAGGEEAVRRNGSAASEQPEATGSTLQLGSTSDDEEDQSVGAPSASSSTMRDAFDVHFASEGQGSHAAALAGMKIAAEGKAEFSWEQTVSQLGELGKVVKSVPLDWKGKTPEVAGPHPNVARSWEQLRQGRPMSNLQNRLVSTLSSYADLYHSNQALEERSEMREAIACHMVSHAVKTRRRVLKNNERMAHAASNSQDIEPPRDQGFTRPKVLLLAPMRNVALQWISLIERMSGCAQTDNKSRLDREFRLPEDAVDKLMLPEARNRYPQDHLETFRGNIDDSFLLGIKLTRKSLKLFSAFYDSDFIVASPLALRLAIEKERGDCDFLSSIEVLVADQLDVTSMQNWDHVQFALDHVSLLPRQTHDTDFSRVKQWYLDGRAANFRQSILLSSYDAPEMRAIFSHTLANVAGKARTLASGSNGDGSDDDGGVMSLVRRGIRQSFVRFECANLQAEAELRFQYFTTKTLPNLLKSALSSKNTLIFVPSYFDFVRLEAYLNERDVCTFAAISEYSTGKDIARARQQFQSGRRSFLLMTERFHFYRRYVIRGARTVVFYGLPEHKDYFVEAMSFPFAKSTSLVEALRQQDDDQEGGTTAVGGEQESVDPSEVSSVALYSRYDLLRLQRIVGGNTARRMVEEDRSTWRFT